MVPPTGSVRSHAWLTWTDADGEHTLPIGGRVLKVKIGRSSSAEAQLSDGEVSRVHAQLEWDGQAWIVRDLDSRNGTRVGAIHAGAGLALAHGDVVRCGQTALALSWPGGALGAVGTSQPETIAGSPPPALTGAETTLLQELCRGYGPGEDPRTSAVVPTSNAQLAERLHLSEDGVRQRLKRLYPKLGLAGDEREKRRELAAQAIALGIVRPAHRPRAVSRGTDRTPT